MMDGRNLNAEVSGGELVRKFVFDGTNQMSESMGFVDGVWRKAEYGYNGLGKRISQSVYPCDGISGRVEEGLEPLRKIAYTLDLTRDYYNLLCEEDDLGSVPGLVGMDGQGKDVLGYEEFGQIRTRGNRRRENVQPFLFTGYQMDEVGGLYFAQARRYDAGTGRFVSEDRVRGFVEAPVTLNRYGYCWGRPTGLVDLDGRFVITAICIAAGVGALASLITSLINEIKDENEGINVKNVAIDTLCGAAAGALIGTGAVIGTLIAGGGGVEQ